MKKQIAMLIWSAVVLFVIIASFVGVYLFDVNSKGYRAKEYEIFSCISTEIEEYSVADKKSEYTLEKTKNGWRVEDNEHIELDEPVITKLLASASNIKAIGTVNKKQFTVFETEDTKTLANAFSYSITTKLLSGKSTPSSFVCLKNFVIFCG